MVRRLHGLSTTSLLYGNTGLRAKHVEQGSANPRRRGIIHSLLGLSCLTTSYSMYYLHHLPGEDANVENFTIDARTAHVNGTTEIDASPVISNV